MHYLAVRHTIGVRRLRLNMESSRTGKTCSKTGVFTRSLSTIRFSTLLTSDHNRRNLWRDDPYTLNPDTLVVIENIINAL